MPTPSTNGALRHAMELHHRGKISEAIGLYQGLLRTNPSNPEALHYLGLAYLQSGDLQNADRFLNRSLTIAPRSLGAQCDLATLRVQQRRWGEALPLLEQILQKDPNHSGALNNIGTVLARMQRPHDAVAHLKRLTLVRPESAVAFRGLADACYEVGDLDAAVEHYRRALELDSEDKLARVSLANTYESQGLFKQARMHYAAVLRRDLNSPFALAGILQLPEGQMRSEWVAQARALAGRLDVDKDDRIRLSVALAHYYDRQQAYDEAFDFLDRGNQLQYAKSPYDSASFTKAVDLLIEVFTGDFLAAINTGGAHDSRRPIFIVGMPRSGTTLVEQILASHSRVAAGGELPTMLNLGAQIQGLSRTKRPYPEGLRDLSSAQVTGLAERYLGRLDAISLAADHVTDKLFFNFMHVGLISVLFPEARIIHCRRNPLDNCLSCYFTSFADQIQFANNLETLGRYYVDYARLMAHWQSVLPRAPLELRYEELVMDTERVVRSLLEYCELGWEQACMAFHKTKRGIKTPSRWQVRQAMYATSLSRARHYEEHLEALRIALAPALPTAERV